MLVRFLPDDDDRGRRGDDPTLQNEIVAKIGNENKIEPGDKNGGFLHDESSSEPLSGGKKVVVV